MRLKEIKPYMAIRCENVEQVYELNKQMKSDKCFEKILSFPCYILTDKNGFSGWLMACNIDFISSENYNPVPKIVEFSDLIIPELTAEDAFGILGEICKGHRYCHNCEIGKFEEGSCPHILSHNKEEVIKVLEQWKADHEKKEPEIETVDICRIIEVLPDGRKRCVHEENMNNPGRTLGDKLYCLDVEEILKRYCMEHDGEYIAVHEVVSRVKAVE